MEKNIGIGRKIGKKILVVLVTLMVLTVSTLSFSGCGPCYGPGPHNEYNAELFVGGRNWLHSEVFDGMKREFHRKNRKHFVLRDETEFTNVFNHFPLQVDFDNQLLIVFVAHSNHDMGFYRIHSIRVRDSIIGGIEDSSLNIRIRFTFDDNLEVFSTNVQQLPIYPFIIRMDIQEFTSIRGGIGGCCRCRICREIRW